MSATKNAIHDKLEADAYVDAEWPHFEDAYHVFADIVSQYLCASDRAKGEHFVIAAALLPALYDEIDRRERD